MLRNRLFPISSSVLFLLVGSSLQAQESGILHGVVKGPDGQAIPEARITLESPALFSPRVLFTNRNGEWRAPLLPIGSFKVTVTKEGFDSTYRSDIRVGIGSNVRIDLALAPIKSAVVEVIGTHNAVIDKTQVNSGANFSAEAMGELPLVDRNFYGALDMTAGTSSSIDGSYIIRGGAATYTNFRVNGAEVKDDYANGLGATWAIDDNIEDAQVVTSQVNVRFGRALGGAVNIVTKSGSNTFEGSLRVKLSRDDWKARTPDTTADAKWSDTLNREYDVTLRGPILKDRLWFAVGTILKPNQAWSNSLGLFPAEANAPMQTGVAGVDALLNAGPGNGYQIAAFDNGKYYTEKFDSHYYEGKLTGALTNDHIVELSFVDQKQVYSNDDASGQALSLASLGSRYNKYQMAGLNYKGILSSMAFLEARYTTSKTTWGQDTGDPAYGGQEGVYVQVGQAGSPDNGLQGFGLPFGFALGATPEVHGNVSAALNLNLAPQAAGSHDIDMGFEYFDSYTDNGEDWGKRSLRFDVGGAYYNPQTRGYLFPTVNYPNNPSDYYVYHSPDDGHSYGAAPFVRQALGPKGRAHCSQLGWYLNETWTLNPNFMMGSGLRIDTNTAKDVDGRTMAKSTDPTYSFIFRWDPKGDSTHLVTFTAANNAGNFNQALFGQFTAKKTTVEVDRGWGSNAADLGAGTPGQVVRFVDYQTLVDLKNYNRVVSFVDQSTRNVLASDLRPPRTQEFTLGYKRGYTDQSRVGITFVYRKWLDMWAQRWDFADPYVITVQDPSHSGLPAMQDITRRYDNSNDLTREYKAVEVEFVKNFGPRWSVQGNYTYSRLTGNNDDGDIAWGGWRNNDPTMGTIMWNPIVLKNMGLSPSDYGASGLLANNQSQKARLALLHVLPLGKNGRMTLALMASYDSGKPWSARNYAAIDQSKWGVDLNAKYPSLGVSPDAVYRQYYSALGAYSYNDTYNVDFKATWDVPLSFTNVHFIGDASVSNVFNVTMPASTYGSFTNDSSNGRTQLFMKNPAYWGTSHVTGSSYYTAGRSAKFSCGFRF
ncbi:carboxypeptidase regulatory-like domain-containing protein [Geothrix sp. PMB-07]|uniref:carboxypeptidase regulatory-like domain-containing protein n=1 Tax=Geothrix sp. PMB-07 TaxID=3068640 RepID=UPI00274072EC|nr:carboxypeptidase regulatory-like domain-containing protein [Geothrix sp. PMB-07]WLT31613.1 carboxypeptidase regulatory-like domain-containing protein [Geothrix sp. PMB-07]